MARLTICSCCEHVVFQGEDDPDFVELETGELMHADCYEEELKEKEARALTPTT